MSKLPRLTLPGTLWFAADLHLAQATPATNEAFIGFLEAAAEEADALLLPGDIFDFWIGDDTVAIAPPWLAAVLEAMRATASQIPLWIGRGNRDFLMGETLAGQLGAQLLPDAVLLETDYRTVLLSHGDEYCTDDQAYQQFRAMVRDPQWQAQFLAMPIPERLKMAQQARSDSMQANQQKSQEIMDVNAQAIDTAFRDTGVSLMIHGHTHRPARHVLQVDGRACERWVLPDWSCDEQPWRGGWFALDLDGLTAYDLEEADNEATEHRS